MREKKLGLGLTLVLLIIAVFVAKFFKLNTMNTALITGILMGNIFLRRKMTKFYPGFHYANKVVLPIAITFLGVKVNYIVLMDLGFKIIGFVILMVVMLLLTARYLARYMLKNENLGSSIGSGGVASIAGSSEVLKVGDGEFAMAIISMNIMGFASMFLIPLISKVLSFNHTQSALYIGGVLSSFIHIIPTAYNLGPESLGLALLIKTGKLLFFPLVLIYLVKTNKSNENHVNKEVKTPKISLPFFVKGFMIVGLFFTLLQYGEGKIEITGYNNIVEGLKTIFDFIYRYLLMFALVGIGGKIDIIEILKNGKTLLKYSFVLLVIQLILGAGIVELFYR